MKTRNVLKGTAAIAVVGGLLYFNQGIDTHYRYERVVRDAYVRALERDPGFAYENDPGAKGYEDALADFYGVGGEDALSPAEVFAELVGSDEYNDKNPNPEPPACEIGPEDCIDGEEFDAENCACVPVAPPPADCQGEPSCYLHIDRARGIVDGTPARSSLMHWCPFTDWRDPEKAGSECPETAGYLGFESANQLVEFGNPVGLELCREGEEKIVPGLLKENRRCDPENPNHDERFLKANGECARSEMRKTRFEDYRDRLDYHELGILPDGEPRPDGLLGAIALRGRAGDCRAALMAAGGGAYDSVAGFCGSLKKAEDATGFTVDDCPNQ